MKTDEHGDRTLKARIVPHGNRDVEKDDIRKDSATAQLSVIRSLLSIVTFLGFRLGFADIKGAYLQSGPIQGDISLISEMHIIGGICNFASVPEKRQMPRTRGICDLKQVCSFVKLRPITAFLERVVATTTFAGVFRSKPVFLRQISTLPSPTLPNLSQHVPSPSMNTSAPPPDPANASGVRLTSPTLTLGSSTRGRSRGRPRGRGRGRGRGSPRLSASSRPGIEDPSKAWKLQAEKPLPIIVETTFAHNSLSERARWFCSFSVSQLGLELRARNLEPTRAGHIVLFMGDVLEQCKTWLNEYISLHNYEKRAERFGMKPND